MPKNLNILETSGLSFTVIPNYFLDQIASTLSSSELRVMLYIYRHTLGYHKLSDCLSYDQFLNGVTTRDGRCLDQGANVSRGSLVGALASLEAKGLIQRLHTRGRNKVLSTTFQIQFINFPTTTIKVPTATNTKLVDINDSPGEVVMEMVKDCSVIPESRTGEVSQLPEKSAQNVKELCTPAAVPADVDDYQGGEQKLDLYLSKVVPNQVQKKHPNKRNNQKPT